MNIVDGVQDPPELKDDTLWFESQNSSDCPEVRLTLVSDIQEIKGDFLP